MDTILTGKVIVCGNSIPVYCPTVTIFKLIDPRIFNLETRAIGTYLYSLLFVDLFYSCRFRLSQNPHRCI